MDILTLFLVARDKFIKGIKFHLQSYTSNIQDSSETTFRNNSKGHGVFFILDSYRYLILSRVLFAVIMGISWKMKSLSSVTIGT